MPESVRKANNTKEVEDMSMRLTKTLALTLRRFRVYPFISIRGGVHVLTSIVGTKVSMVRNTFVLNAILKVFT